LTKLTIVSFRSPPSTTRTVTARLIISTLINLSAGIVVAPISIKPTRGNSLITTVGVPGVTGVGVGVAGVGVGVGITGVGVGVTGVGVGVTGVGVGDAGVGVGVVGVGVGVVGFVH
jgi:hypothetical protein